MSKRDEQTIVKTLEEDIIFGRVAPGERITEKELLERFSVSRHQVRQALGRLETMGIVVLERNKGATVRSLTSDEVQQIYAVRELVQRQAALWIPLPVPGALITALSEIQNEHDFHARAGYLRGVHEANDRFHLTLFGACGNQHLVDMIELYMSLTLPVRAASMANPQHLKIFSAHHRLMIEMLSGRDNWVLAQLCVDHLQPSKQEYLTRVASGNVSAEPTATHFVNNSPRTTAGNG